MSVWKIAKNKMMTAFDAWAASSPFGFSFVLVAIFFTVVYCFFTAYYQENDDVFKILFAKGVGASLSPSEYLGDSNILAGLLLRRLYTWNTRIPWYGLYLSVPLFGGVWAMGAALFLAKRSLWLRSFFFALLCGGLFTYYLYQYEFTVTPQIAAQGALLLLAASFENGNSVFRFKAYLLASVLIAAACIIRLDSLLLTLVIAIPWLFYFTWRNREKCFRWKWMGYVTLMSLFVAGATFFSWAYYNHSPDWKQFQEFNHLIKSLHDYRNVVYNEQTRTYLDEVGWTDNDASMFHDYCYVDAGVNNAENYRKLIPHFSRFTNVGKLGTVNSLGGIFHDTQVRAACMLMFIYFLFLPPYRRILFGVNILWLLGIFLFLIYYMRCPPRIYLPCLSFVALLELLWVENLPKKTIGGVSTLYRYLRGFAVVIVIATLLCIVVSGYRANQKRVMAEQYMKKIILQMHPDDRQLFVIWGSSLTYEDIHAFDDFEIFRHFHIYPLAVFQRSPHGVNLLQHYGIHKNLFFEMRDRPDVFLICQNFEGYFYGTYMMEKYFVKTHAEKYFDSYFFKAYRIKTDDKNQRNLVLNKKRAES